MMGKQTVTVGECIQHIIPGVDVSTEIGRVLAIEACKIIIDMGTMNDRMTRTFDHWYRTEWRDHKHGGH